MKTVTRQARVVGGFLAASALMAGCSGGSSNDASGGEEPGVAIAHPVTGFADKARWKVTAKTLEPGSVTTQAGPVLLVRGDDGMYTLRGLGSKEGRQSWESRPFKGGDSAPVVRATTQLGHPYVLVLSRTGRDAQLDVYDAYATTPDTTPVSRVKMTADSDAGVKMVTSSGGVIFSGATKPAKAFTVDLPTGNVSTYGKSPNFEGSSDGKPVSVMNGAFLLSYPKGYVVASGYSSGSWTSKSITPQGMKPGSGKLLAAGDSLVISRWDKTGGGASLVAQSALNGQVVSTVDESPSAKAAEDDSADVRLAFDGSWAQWKGYAFDLRTHKGAFVNATRDIRPVMIVRGVEYGMKGNDPVAVSLKDGASAEVKPAGMVPVGIASNGLGLFSDKNDVYGIPLK